MSAHYFPKLCVFLLGASLCCFVVPEGLAASAVGEAACGPLETGGYGPYDYTNPIHFREKLPIVEGAHFDAGVESLRGHLKKNAGTLDGDLDYTLRAFPNHHRA